MDLYLHYTIRLRSVVLKHRGNFDFIESQDTADGVYFVVGRKSQTKSERIMAHN
jgi:hypothetical protein